jgi:hypothetical protein
MILCLHTDNGVCDILGAFVGNFEDFAEAYAAGAQAEQWCTLQAIPQTQRGEWEAQP